MLKNQHKLLPKALDLITKTTLPPGANAWGDFPNKERRNPKKSFAIITIKETESFADSKIGRYGPTSQKTALRKKIQSESVKAPKESRNFVRQNADFMVSNGVK